MDLSSLEKDPRLFLYTSLTAGSSHIITATSRMETILKANKIPFQAIDIATDEKARKLWQRRGGQRKLPGLVKEGYVLGDLNEVEEWNEFGELRENIGPVPANNNAPKGGQVGVQTAPPLSHNVDVVTAASSRVATASKPSAPPPGVDKKKAILLPGATEMAARIKDRVATTSTTSQAKRATEDGKESQKSVSAFDHLSAPASRIPSGTTTPVTSGEKATGSTKASVQQPREVAEAESDTKPQGSDAAEGSAKKVASNKSQDLLTESKKVAEVDESGDDATTEATAALKAVQLTEQTPVAETTA